MFQAYLRGWKRLAAGLVLVPGLAGGEVDAVAQSGPFASDSKSASKGVLTDTKKKDTTKKDGEKASTGKTTASVPSKKNVDPKVLVKQGRDALAAGKLDLAQDLARQAEATKPSSRWGMFDDTPADLLKDVQKAKSKRDRQDSDKLLADARMLYEKKAASDSDRMSNLEKAQTLAYQAERLHGPYSIWDMGDRPSKLLAEIETAKAKLKPTTGSTTATVKTTPSTKGDPSKTPKMELAKAQPKMTEPKKSGYNPDTVAVKPKTDNSVAVKPKLDKLPDLKPEMKPELLMDGLKIPAMDETPSASLAKDESKDADHKKEAIACMQEANKLQVQKRFVEAKVKLTEASKHQMLFSPDEESPQVALLKLESAANKELAALCNEASELMMKRSSNSMAQAEAKLQTADALAKGMGLDDHPIKEHRAALLASKSGGAIGTSVATAPTPDNGLILPTVGTTSTPSTPVVNNGQGAVLMKNARAELRKGELENARRLAEEVIAGNHENKEEAKRFLNTVNAEETEQRKRIAMRSYESGLVAYQNKDYRQALAIFQLIDPSLLPSVKQASMKDLMVTCTAQVKSVGDPVVKGNTKVDPSVMQAGGPEPKGMAQVTDPLTPKTGADSLLKQQEALQEIEFQKLRSESLTVQKEAELKFGKGETDAAVKMLQDYVAKVKDSKIEPTKVALLTRSVENRLENFRIMKKQQDVLFAESKEKRRIKDEMKQEMLAVEHKKAEVAKLMKQYSNLMDEKKFAEAEMIAMKAHELDSDDPTTMQAMQVAKTAKRVMVWDKIKKDKEEFNWEVGNEAHKFGPPVTLKNPLSVDPEAFRRGEMRAEFANGLSSLRNQTQQEREIQLKLKKNISIDFKGTPLPDVIDFFRLSGGVNISLDKEAIAADNLNPNFAVTENIRDIPMESALNVILKKAHLTHIVEDNVLKVTTEKRARGKLVRKVFPVADLVIPIENYQVPTTANFNEALERHIRGTQSTIQGLSPTPFTPSQGLGTGQGTPVGNSMASGAGGRIANNQPGGGGFNVTMGRSETIENALMKLIKQSIRPDSWDELGGAGTLDYYPMGLALVVNQTSDVVAEVQDLLDNLRRLLDLEVAVELRLVSLEEAFFERIGVDFSLNIKTDTTKIEPSITSGIFRSEPFLNDNNFKGQALGLTPAGTFTPDLDIPIRATSFQYAVPSFGNFPNQPGNNGGLSLGLAFLNDIQVFMFMEAAQGDRRTNVMSAPKLTMQNGQSANLNIADQQFFVTGVQVISVNGQIVFNPQNNVFPFGLQLGIRPVVSADRLSVRLDFFSSITGQFGNAFPPGRGSALVPLFPVTTFITPVFDGGFLGPPVPFTQFIQQPTFTQLGFQTSVAVPDGGTVLLGGLKSLSENRNEFGPPVLSKIPYVNRLFKNVAYGREAQSLMIMVTPRIIVNREEQERQTGIPRE